MCQSFLMIDRNYAILARDEKLPVEKALVFRLHSAFRLRGNMVSWVACSMQTINFSAVRAQRKTKVFQKQSKDLQKKHSPNNNLLAEPRQEIDSHCQNYI